MPLTPVIDRLGADSVPNTEAPLVTDWGSAGTSELRARMLFTTAAAAVVMMEPRLSDVTGRVVGLGGSDTSGVLLDNECMTRGRVNLK